jgi:hypothetical protein
MGAPSNLDMAPPKLIYMKFRKHRVFALSGPSRSWEIKSQAGHCVGGQGGQGGRVGMKERLGDDQVEQFC